jgi:hypothetical protein
MTRYRIVLCMLLIFFFSVSEVTAQFRGSNLAEYQLGNIPDEHPPNLNSIYNQLNLNYRYKKFSLYARGEFFASSFGENTDYARFSQYRASYKTKWLSVDAGHQYTSFGRGLLMRNYEIPSSVYESRGYRVRHGFYKDMYGITAKFKSKYVNVKLLRGKTLTVELPPTLNENERRNDLVEGAEADINLKGQTLALIYMRHHASGNLDNYASVYYNGNIQDLTIYGELARRIDSLGNISSFGTDDGFGAYLGINYSWQKVGISLEYKKYNNFSIGNGVNDPPTLVKEHSFRLLNRSTHVPLLFNETGYQAELYYSFENGTVVTINHARAENKLATNSFIFREYYADITAYINKKILTKTFIDYAIDPLTNEKNRYTAGATIDVEHAQLSSTVNGEIQFIKRVTNVTESITNAYFSYTLAKASQYSVGVVLEISNDPFLLNEGETEIYYPSINATWQLGKKNKLTAFYGKRRGGPACNSGVCYDVLDFEGFELRLNTRF